MLERLYTSLVQPRRVGMYLADKWGKIILYVLILSVVASIPLIIVASAYNGLSNQSIINLENTIEESKDHIPNAKIENYKFESTESGYFYIDSYRISINEEKTTAVAVLLKEDGIVLSSMGVETTKISYEALQIENLDFEKLKNGDANELKVVVNTLDLIIKKTKPVWLPIQIITAIISSIINYLIMCLILALILKIGSMIPFLAIFKLTLYANTISQILLLFSNLYGFTILYYASGIFGIIYSVLAIKSIIIRRR